MNRLYRCWVLFIVSLSGTGSAFANDKTWLDHTKGQPGNPVVISTFALDEPRLVAIEALVGRIYDHAGITYTLRRYPISRSFLEADHGVTDAELVRFEEVTEIAPALRAIPVSIFTLTFRAFARKDAPALANFNELYGRRIGIPSGIFLLEKFFEHFEVHRGDSLESMFKMLEAQRLDYVVYMAYEAQSALQGSHGQALVVKSDIIVQEELFHFVNARYVDIIDRLTHAASEMEQSGTMATLRKELMSRFQ